MKNAKKICIKDYLFIGIYFFKSWHFMRFSCCCWLFRPIVYTRELLYQRCIAIIGLPGSIYIEINPYLKIGSIKTERKSERFSRLALNGFEDNSSPPDLKKISQPLMMSNSFVQRILFKAKFYIGITKNLSEYFNLIFSFKNIHRYKTNLLKTVFLFKIIF